MPQRNLNIFGANLSSFEINEYQISFLIRVNSSR